MGGKPLGEHMPALAAAARDWHGSIVLPVRAARRKLKADAGNSLHPEIKAVYKTVRAAELDCERAELLMLAARADALLGPTHGAGSPSVVTENLSAFLAVSGVAPTGRDRLSMDAILDGANRLSF